MKCIHKMFTIIFCVWIVVIFIQNSSLKSIQSLSRKYVVGGKHCWQLFTSKKSWISRYKYSIAPTHYSLNATKDLYVEIFLCERTCLFIFNTFIYSIRGRISNNQTLGNDIIGNESLYKNFTFKAELCTRILFHHYINTKKFIMMLYFLKSWNKKIIL